MSIIGIDIGPLGIVTAVVEDEGPAVIPDAYGRTCIPVAEDDRVAAFTKARQIAEMHLGQPVTEAVLIVSEELSDEDRYLRKEEGEAAGLDFRRIVNRPVAGLLGVDVIDSTDEQTCLVLYVDVDTVTATLTTFGDCVVEILHSTGPIPFGGFIDDDDPIGVFGATREAIRRSQGFASTPLDWVQVIGRVPENVAEWQDVLALLGGVPQISTPDPISITAIGAARIGDHLKDDVTEFISFELTELPLGTIDRYGRFVPLIDRNTVLPWDRRFTFTVPTAVQDIATMHLACGLPDGCAEVLGTLSVRLNGSTTVDVRWEIDWDGSVQITVLDGDTPTGEMLHVCVRETLGIDRAFELSAGWWNKPELRLAKTCELPTAIDVECRMRRCVGSK